MKNQSSTSPIPRLADYPDALWCAACRRLGDCPGPCPEGHPPLWREALEESRRPREE